MQITLNDLTISPEGLDPATLLSSWNWAMEEPILPILITAMGDAIAVGESGAVYFVDATCGTIERIADDVAALEGLLSDTEFVTEKLLPGRVVSLRGAEMQLGPGEVYSHINPLVLGGEDEIANYETTDADVHFGVMGQIHKQIKDLPPGSTTCDFKFE